MFQGALPVTAAEPQRQSSLLRYATLALALACIVLVAGCASRKSPAPVADQSRSGATAQAQGTYVVRPGDTLYSVAQNYGMSVARLSSLNGITDPTQLAVGQVLRLDEGTAMPAPGVAQGALPSATPAAPPPPVAPVPPARASDANLISWGWPTSGKIIQGFDANTKGIDIEGSVGAPVVAAADGKVMYAGNGVRGLGNLILLGHTDGFITAYAHNQSLLVKTGESVKKGSKIATLGDTDTTSPRLHFEIRRRGTALDPLAYLPAQ